METTAGMSRPSPRIPESLLLVAALVFHVWILPYTGVAGPVIVLAALGGLALQIFQCFPPYWYARLFTAAGAAAASLTAAWTPSAPGIVACSVAALLLYRPLRPGRSLGIVLCLLVALVNATLIPENIISPTWIFLDVVFLLFLAQQVNLPVEAPRELWDSFRRSLLLIVPVGTAVWFAFWLFPGLSQSGQNSWTGFAGGDSIHPGDVAGIRQSRRVAFVARFSEESELPPGGDLYWRAGVMEQNQGLRWRRDPRRLQNARAIRPASLASPPMAWSYQLELRGDLQGALPLLEMPFVIKAERGSTPATVVDLGAGIYSLTGSRDALIQAESGPLRPMDPVVEIAPELNLEVPTFVAANPALIDLAHRIVGQAGNTQSALHALNQYLQEEGFTYSSRPGWMEVHEVGAFLLQKKRGFCEHYATATANLLRLGGIPARVVTGFRGGEWNPWLRVLTVRDSDAHAWVEAWDSETARWLRYDPTDAVAPERRQRLQREMFFEQWSWRRQWEAQLSRFLNEAWTAALDFARSYSIQFWTIALIGLTGLLVFWGRMLRSWISTNASPKGHPRQPTAKTLQKLEKILRNSPHRREPRETPLQWLARIGREIPAARDASVRLADLHEQLVYSGNGVSLDKKELSSALREIVRAFRKTNSSLPW